MSGYCTTAQLILGWNAQDILDYSDDNADGSADTGVQQAAIDRASRWIWGYLRQRYQAVTAMAPASYAAGTYPILEEQAISLARACLQERQGGAPVTDDHPSLRWAFRCSVGLNSAEA